LRPANAAQPLKECQVGGGDRVPSPPRASSRRSARAVGLGTGQLVPWGSPPSRRALTATACHTLRLASPCPPGRPTAVRRDKASTSRLCPASDPPPHRGAAWASWIRGAAGDVVELRGLATARTRCRSATTTEPAPSTGRPWRRPAPCPRRPSAAGRNAAPSLFHMLRRGNRHRDLGGVDGHVERTAVPRFSMSRLAPCISPP
jgi:hypothetical protein